MTVGTAGAAQFDFYAKYALRAGSDITVRVHLVYPTGHASAGQDVDLSGWNAPFVGAFRRELNEDLTTAPLARYTAEWVTDGTDGLLDLIILGSAVTQAMPDRGYHNLFGVSYAGDRQILIGGRFRSQGATVDPLTPA